MTDTLIANCDGCDMPLSDDGCCHYPYCSAPNPAPMTDKQRIATLTAENERLREALEEMRSRRQSVITAYERNGPQWTSKDGSELESTSGIIAAAEEDVQVLEAALKGQS